jgi:hypothetical protein
VEIIPAAPAKKWTPPPRGDRVRGRRHGATAVEQPARGKMTVVLAPPETNKSGGGAAREGGAGPSGRDPITAAAAAHDLSARPAATAAPPSAPRGAPSSSSKNKKSRGIDTSAAAPPDATRTLREELAYVRNLQREVRDLRALRAKLEALREVAASAAPPVLPTIERRLTYLAPDGPYRDAVRQSLDDAILPAFEREVLPRLPEGVRCVLYTGSHTTAFAW